MSGLGEQIAVLDGITIAPGDGMYGGGASYPDDGRWPLLPSSGGLNQGMSGPLGAHNDLEAFAAATYPQDLPNVAPKKRVFASYSGGANMSGGSSYPEVQFPTWAQGGAGMSGLGACGCRLNGLGTLPNYLPPGRVFASAPQGANYSGGSNYPEGGKFPLLSSTIGLAAAMRPGARRQMPPMTRDQMMTAIQLHSQRMVNAKKALAAVKNPQQQVALMQEYRRSATVLCILRSKVGLPTLPECQSLVARMKALWMAKAAQQQRRV